MKAKIRVTNEYDIEVSECGEFCLKDCKKISHIKGGTFPTVYCNLNGDRLFDAGRGDPKRTDFCKRNEVKG
jgi:hypothetical protein